MLKFVNPYLSIVPPFNDVELPPFTVLTGKNGSGKSHLLTAIQNGHVQATTKINPKIISFNYETFKLENEAVFKSQSIIDEKQTAWNYFENQVKQNLIAWKTVLQPTDQILIEGCRLTRLPVWEVVGSPQIENYKTSVETFFRNPQGNQLVNKSLLRLARSLPYTLDHISRADFEDTYKQFEYKDDFLPRTLGKVFWEYQYKKQVNGYSHFRNDQEGLDLPVLTSEEFVEKFGSPPWEIVNRIMKEVSGLDYEVLSPSKLGVFDQYQMKLVSISNPNLQIEFSSLSSGERVLMALVASIFANSDFDRPDLLLLDELDATLHPSMIRSLIKVIETEFVDRGTQVLLITHSPTTVALAPEESVFVMHRIGSERITKSTRQEALKILTEGFVTLDDGLAVIREIFDNNLTIITEGRNVAFLEQYIELKGIKDVKVMRGLESKTGSTSMKAVFDFLQIVPHSSKILFVWDCDVERSFGKKVESVNNTVPFFLPKNPNNRFAESGIENLFSEELMEDMTIKTLNPDDTIRNQTFSKDCKVRFEERVLSRRNLADYILFEPLFEAIENLRCPPVE